MRGLIGAVLLTELLLGCGEAESEETAEVGPPAVAQETGEVRAALASQPAAPSEPVSVDKTICVMPVDLKLEGFVVMKNPAEYWKCTDSGCVLESKVMPSGQIGYRCNCGHGSIMMPVWVTD
ncbi:hypothetical protein KH5H1_71950 [Corallococcus caeni]|uniref:hypothetical protein n=1 Tax=Corallococcus caeni TaxID=3082388 RepID=UPI002955F8B0|nr:hypothetical protein KH5H1_71950 [Corallococcus sp. KH5-1]